MFESGAPLLQGRYTLTRELQPGAYPKVWLAEDADNNPVMVKAWVYEPGGPNAEVERVLWDQELRTVYRLTSLPGAEATLVTLRDAGIDYQHGHYLMVLSAKGLTQLYACLTPERRRKTPWLQTKTQIAARAELWRALRQLADGLLVIHRQQMLHRNLSSHAVFLDADEGPASFRLGGFEWALRLGADFRGGGASVVPPELQRGASHYSVATDWFSFGVLATELLVGLPPREQGSSDRDFLKRMVARLREEAWLYDRERDLLERLLGAEPQTRLGRGEDVLREIVLTIDRLEEPASAATSQVLGLVVNLGRSQSMTEKLLEKTRQLDEKGELKILFDADATDAQRAWIEADLESARVTRAPSSDEAYILFGTNLCYRIRPHRPDEDAQPSWDLAFCPDTTVLTRPPETETVPISIPIRVYTPRILRRDDVVVTKQTQSWKRHLPSPPKVTDLQQEWRRFLDFLRLTNQFEVLFRAAEIFPYRVVSETQEKDARLSWCVVELTERARELLPFVRRVRQAEGLDEEGVRYLDDQRRERQRTDAPFRVYLGPEEYLITRRLDPAACWDVVDPGLADGAGRRLLDAEPPAATGAARVLLRRETLPRQEPPPQDGFLRIDDHSAQTLLINRRQMAISRMEQHGYLLRALLEPDYVRIDLGDKLPLIIDREKIDQAKAEAMQNIWRTRPIFALQGPPGTGKTTMVANLLGQIFSDNPVAQVLVTAQAHSAVDVLREKVRDVFNDSPSIQNLAEEERPLAIRIGARGAPDGAARRRQRADSREEVAESLLRIAQDRLAAEQTLTPLQTDWLRAVREMVAALANRSLAAGAGDFAELVSRAASITYSTATAGELAAMAARGDRTFDWCIVEEAGKAHGFELVLPMQMGHRWLLIGDQRQLEPYRYDDFKDGIEKYLARAVAELRNLPAWGGNLVDRDFVTRWEQDYVRTGKDAALRDTCKHWLLTFDTIYRRLEALSRAGTEREAKKRAPMAQMLYQQHRMHPSIAALISRAYYDRPIESMTIELDGRPKARVVHPFGLPTGVAERAIVWLDVPRLPMNGAASHPGAMREGYQFAAAEAEAVARFLRELRVDDTADAVPLRLAVLTPYRRQVFDHLVPKLREFYSGAAPEWLDVGEVDGPQRLPRVAHTVDSFQGNQADVIVVSLVRNNHERYPDQSLGFLKKRSRMNVLLSRAERLLVLVGNWQFFVAQADAVGSPASSDPDVRLQTLRDEPLGHWKIIIEYLEDCFSNGTAVRIPAPRS